MENVFNWRRGICILGITLLMGGITYFFCAYKNYLIDDWICFGFFDFLIFQIFFFLVFGIKRIDHLVKILIFPVFFIVSCLTFLDYASYYGCEGGVFSWA